MHGRRWRRSLFPLEIRRRVRTSISLSLYLYRRRPTYVEPLYILDNDGLGLQGASGLAVDAHDRIFISDTGHHRIVICTPDGSYITHFSTEGDQPGELKRPCGLDITRDGTVVVTDSGNKRIQFFGAMREQAVTETSASAETSADRDASLLIDMDSASARQHP